MNATALKVKWTGHSLFPTRVHYQSFFNETGVPMIQYISVFPTNVASFELNVDDSVPGYLHTFFLQFVEHIETPITTTSFSFGKSLPLGWPLNLIDKL